MTVREFIDKNSDILYREVIPAELPTLEQGTALFCISIYNGTASKYTRKIVSAGYCLVDHAMMKDGLPSSIDIIRRTTGYYTKMDNIRPTDVADTGNKALFRCRPISVDDPRFNRNWNEWPV